MHNLQAQWRTWGYVKLFLFILCITTLLVFNSFLVSSSSAVLELTGGTWDSDPVGIYVDGQLVIPDTTICGSQDNAIINVTCFVQETGYGTYYVSVPADDGGLTGTVWIGLITDNNNATDDEYYGFGVQIDNVRADGDFGGIVRYHL